MTATAIATALRDTCFFSNGLRATQDPQTARVCGQTWKGNLQMGLQVAMQLAGNLHTETVAGDPQKETIIALYLNLVSLSTAHPARDALHAGGKKSVARENTLGVPLAQATAIVTEWYCACVNTERRSSGAISWPTVQSAEQVYETIRQVSDLDLATAAQPHIDNYNALREPGQVFRTTVALFREGGPLAWQTGGMAARRA